jgi:hypothetical protein
MASVYNKNGDMIGEMYPFRIIIKPGTVTIHNMLTNVNLISEDEQKLYETAREHCHSRFCDCTGEGCQWSHFRDGDMCLCGTLCQSYGDFTCKVAKMSGLACGFHNLRDCPYVDESENLIQKLARGEKKPASLCALKCKQKGEEFYRESGRVCYFRHYNFVSNENPFKSRKNPFNS